MLVSLPRALVLCLLLLVVVALSSPALAAQTWENCAPLQTHVGNQGGSLFGWIGVQAGDVDGDLVEDYLITAPQQGASKGRVKVYSGATGAELWGITGLAGETLGISSVSINSGGAFQVFGGLFEATEPSTCIGSPPSCLGLE